MNIPEEVLERADEAFFDAEGDGLTASYAVIAEWARKEALREAAAVLRGEGEPGHGGEFISVNHAEELIADLLEGEPK